MNEREEALAHFGVKGMRWGSRKTGSKTSVSTLNISDNTTVKVVKKGASIAARVGSTTWLTGMGIPPVFAGMAVAAVVAAMPFVVSAGKSFVNDTLIKLGA